MTTEEPVLSAVAIVVVAAALLTDAVGLLGERLNLEEGVVGSVLVAVRIAVPEAMIPIVSVVAPF
jgi:cation:H+ antiporter